MLCQWIQSTRTLVFASTKHKTPAICQVNKRHLMFDASGPLVWRRTARCESGASTASYASQRKLDKRIILIALAQPFPSSRSTWWSARSPPCYSLCASQVSTCMSVFISQVALAWLFFSSPLSRCAQVWMGIGLIYLFCAAYQWIVEISKWTQVIQKRTLWLNMLLACNYVLYHVCRAYSTTENNTEHAIIYMINESSRKSWPIIGLCENQGGGEG